MSKNVKKPKGDDNKKPEQKKIEQIQTFGHSKKSSISNNN